MSTININSGNFSNNHHSVIGNHNKLSNDTTGILSWDILDKDAQVLLNQLPKQSNQQALISNLQKFIIKKDERGLKDFIKKHACDFNISFLAGICSGALIELIQKFCT